MGSVTSLKCVLTQEHLDAICAKYFVLEEVHPQLPSSDATVHKRPAGKVEMYTRFFDYANYRIPFSTFFMSVLTHFRIPFSQLSVFGSAKVSHIEIMCRICNINPSVDSVKNWNDYFFWVDEFAVPANARFGWFSGTNIVKDRAPAPSEYNMEHVNTLIAQASPFLRFPEEFLCWVGISRNYLLNKDTYPRFEYENEKEMDLNAFIHTADPRKVRIVERARAENERPIVTVAKHRTRGGGQEDSSIAGHGNVRPVVPITDDIVAEADVSRPKRSKKKRVIRGSEGTPAASHPPKRLRADYGRIGGSTAGALPTLPFITSSVTASPLEEGGDHTDSVTGPSLRSVAASARFVALSDSSHHSATNSAGLEGDSFVRSVVPVMTEATTVTTIATTIAIPADVGKDKSVSHPSVFGSSSSSEKTDRTLSLFTGRSGSGFAAGSIRAEEVTDAGLEEIYVPEWTVTKGFELNDGRSCANMIDHFTPPAFFKTKRKWRSLAEEKDSLLGAKDKEIEELRSQLLKAKEEFVVVTQLRARVSSLEAIEGSLRGEVASVKGYNDLLEQERNALRLQVASLESTVAEKDRELSDLEISSSSSLRSQNQGLVSQVHELETSSARLREQLDLYEGNMKRCYIRFQESFHPHLLNVVAGRRWLLTHGMKLLMAKCLNSTEYMEALGNAFGRAIEKRMQEDLAAGIEHGQAGRCLTDLEAYIPSAEELSNKKDASTWDVMDLLRLDDVVAEALGMTDLQPDVNQLMVPVHHKQDRVVIGSQALSVALDICRGRVEKMERNLVERLPFLKDVFVSLDHPLSDEALIEPPVVVPATNVLSTMVINVTLGPEGEENIDASTGDDLAFSKLDDEARDVVL
ncbi:hypothetical protein Tco_0573243 [Tanacetum coccineum]